HESRHAGAVQRLARKREAPHESRHAGCPGVFNGWLPRKTRSATPIPRELPLACSTNAKRRANHATRRAFRDTTDLLTLSQRLFESPGAPTTPGFATLRELRMSRRGRSLRARSR